MTHSPAEPGKPEYEIPKPLTDGEIDDITRQASRSPAIGFIRRLLATIADRDRQIAELRPSPAPPVEREVEEIRKRHDEFERMLDGRWNPDAPQHYEGKVIHADRATLLCLLRSPPATTDLETRLAEAHAREAVYVNALRGAESWLESWQSAEPYLSTIKRALADVSQAAQDLLAGQRTVGTQEVCIECRTAFWEPACRRVDDRAYRCPIARKPGTGGG